MPEADQKKVHRAVAQLETAFPNVERLHKVDQYLWSFHVARELRMLVRTVGNALRVIALASPEQIQRYSVGASANASAHVFGVLGLSMDFHRWWIGYSALLARVVRIPLNEL